MNTLLARASIVLGAGIVATMHAAGAQAACGTGDWSGPAANWPQVTATAIASVRSAGGATQAGTSRPDAFADIVGLWSVTFTAEDNPGGPPDGTVIDAGYATWHADRTEIMNSGRPPITGNFCMGVWKVIAPATYKLNHVALSWHPDPNDPNLSAFDGPVSIRETVRMDPSGNSYKGKFTIDQYDQNGNPVAHVNGRIDATRITADD
jgi:hypothetical protein